MPTSYGQFCPVAKAMEVLDERWTMLVIRELMMGSRHFNAIRRGVPRMSPALLSKRLQMLVRSGVVERRPDGSRVTYHLTDAGRELEPIVQALGQWGVRWVDHLGEEDLDPHLLFWDVQRNIDMEAVPAGRTVIEFRLSDEVISLSARNWWLVITADSVDMCDVDPGHHVSVTVWTSLRVLTELWRGDVGWATVLRSGQVTLSGETYAQRALPRWLKLSSLASTPRPEPALVGR